MTGLSSYFFIVILLICTSLTPSFPSNGPDRLPLDDFRVYQSPPALTLMVADTQARETAVRSSTVYANLVKKSVNLPGILIVLGYNFIRRRRRQTKAQHSTRPDREFPRHRQVEFRQVQERRLFIGLFGLLGDVWSNDLRLETRAKKQVH